MVMPKVFRGKLDKTATYATRWWMWLVTPGLPCDGILILGQVAEKSGDVDEQTYGVEEVGAVHGPGWRTFAVRKLGAEVGAEDEAYTTSIGPRSTTCTCKAGRVRNEICRHRDSLKAAIDAGVLPKKATHRA